MLSPHNRALLTKMLQPPRGYNLKQAVGTTFTLDLATALTVPLSFAAGDQSGEDDVGIIAALAQFADRLTIFCQAGEIRPGVQSDLVALLEQVVQPVHPSEGIFHPKVWFLEYEQAGRHRYRFLCLSRNLTQDRSWDLSVQLDGEPAASERRVHCAALNQPLVDLLHRLPTLTVGIVQDQRLQQIAGLADRFSTVDWELPPGVRELSFYLLDGSDPDRADGTQMLQYPSRESLVISPFVSAEGLQHVRRHTARQMTLVSRPPALDQLAPESLEADLETWVLDDLLAEADETAPEALSGLHAKAVFMRHRHRPSTARALIGSANITGGGLRSNIEFVVECLGHVRELGPQAVLEDIAPMLEPYPASGGEAQSEDEAGRQALEARLRSLAAGSFHAQVFSADPYGMHVWWEEPTQRQLEAMRADGITITCGLLSQSGHQRSLIREGADAFTVRPVQLEQITPFLQLSLSQRLPEGNIKASTVVPARLHDDVDGRRDAVLARGITDGHTFLRLLALLLDPGGADFTAWQGGEGPAASPHHLSDLGSGIFEPLLRSLARGDEGLDMLQRILVQLRQHGKAELELPEEFTQLWDNVWQARSAHERGSR